MASEHCNDAFCFVVGLLSWSAAPCSTLRACWAGGSVVGSTFIAMPDWMLRLRAVSLPSKRCPASSNLTSVSGSPEMPE